MKERVLIFIYFFLASSIYIQLIKCDNKYFKKKK